MQGGYPKRIGRTKVRLCAHGAVLAATALIGFCAFSSNAGTTNYTYDALGRVVAVYYPGGSTDNFQYDSAGNRTQVARNAPTPPAPTVGAASLTVAYNTAGSVVLSPSGVWSSLALASGPSHGSASISGTTATYTPTSGYSGSDSFTYTATGPGGTSSPASVSVTVQAPPARPPVCSAYTINISGVPTQASANVTVTSGMILGQCTDPNGYTLSVTSPTNLPETLTIRGGTSATVSYTVSDGHGNTASNSIQINVQ